MGRREWIGNRTVEQDLGSRFRALTVIDLNRNIEENIGEDSLAEKGDDNQ